MAGRKAFVDVLEEALDGYQPEAAPRGTHPSLGFATPSIFIFQSGVPTARNGSFAYAVAAPPPPRQPRRTLSPRQQDALDAFVQFGASLGDNFTDTELRRAFRALALQYHPDRHPDSSDTQRAHLSVRFSQLHDAYESLKSLSSN
jgi:hypothetical protein